MESQIEKRICGIMRSMVVKVRNGQGSQNPNWLIKRATSELYRRLAARVVCILTLLSEPSSRHYAQDSRSLPVRRLALVENVEAHNEVSNLTRQWPTPISVAGKANSLQR
jgi:hypothetical protein